MSLEDDICDMRIMREMERHREKSMNRGIEREKERERLNQEESDFTAESAQFICRSAHTTSRHYPAVAMQRETDTPRRISSKHIVLKH